MAQYVTLEEAARRLGIRTEEFKKRLKTEWTHIVPMRDGPTLRFRVTQIDELARQLGAASDPGLPLAGLGDESVELGSDDFKVPQTGKPAKPVPPPDEPLLLDGSDDDIFSLSVDESKPASGGPGKKSPDSDVRLAGGKSGRRREEAAAVPTEEIALDVSGPGSAVIKGGSSAKLSATKSSGKIVKPESGKKLSAESGKKKGDSSRKLSSDSGRTQGNQGLGDSSEFELSLDADSDDFELQLNADSSDEVDLGSSSVDEGGDRAGKSGINLRSPADSGVSLEKGNSGRNLSPKPGGSERKSGIRKPDSSRGAAKKATTDSDSDVDFELSLDTGPGASSSRHGAGKSGRKPPVTSDSDSEFELTLDDSKDGSSMEADALSAAEDESKGDIFETDFEIPPMTDESGSEAVALDSDTDLETPSEVELALDEGDAVAEEETGSQVVVLEDEDDQPTPSGRRRGAGEVDLADVELEEDSASSALAGVKGRRRHDDDEDDEEMVPASRAVALAPAPWGPLPALILFPAFVLVIVGGLMGYELLHTMMGYQQPRKPSAPLVRGLAKTLDMDVKDQ